MLAAILALAALAPQDLEVTVVEVKGSVETKRPGKENRWAKLEKGATLKRGTMVQTGLKSHAFLHFGESTKVLVRPSTFAVINESYLEKNAFRGDLRVDVGTDAAARDRARALAETIQTASLCGLGQAAPMALLRALETFGEAFGGPR